jgi:hypothetical protein
MRFGDPDLDYPSLIVEAATDGFAAATEVWLPRAHLRAFLAQLEEFDRTLSGSAILEADDGVCGAIRLALQPHGRAGRVRVDVDLKRHIVEGFSQAARLAYVLPEPNAVTRFRLGLARALAGEPDGSALLSELPQPAPA